MAAPILGAVVGLLVIGRLPAERQSSLVLRLALLTPLPLLVTIFEPPLPVVWAAWFVCGALQCYMLPLQAAFTLLVPTAMRGRVFGLAGRAVGRRHRRLLPVRRLDLRAHHPRGLGRHLRRRHARHPRAARGPLAQGGAGRQRRGHLHRGERAAGAPAPATPPPALRRGAVGDRAGRARPGRLRARPRRGRGARTADRARHPPLRAEARLRPGAETAPGRRTAPPRLAACSPRSTCAGGSWASASCATCCRAPSSTSRAAVETVRPICEDVRHRGAAALYELGERFDGVRPATPARARRRARRRADGLDPPGAGRARRGHPPGAAGPRGPAPHRPRPRPSSPGGEVTERWVPSTGSASTCRVGGRSTRPAWS